MTGSQMSPENIRHGWDMVWHQAKTWQNRTDTQGAWPFAPGSKIAGDNKRTRPFQTSHACRALLHAAIDHHHALISLYSEAHSMHTFAGASLTRAAIEAASLAIWILEPDSRRERALRTLRWNAKDFADEMRFQKASMGLEVNTRAELIERLGPSAARAGVELLEAIRGVRSTEAVLAANAYATSMGEAMGPLLYWQLTSGFAHARRWSSLAFAQQEMCDTDDPDVVNVRLSMTEDRLLAFAFASAASIELALGLWESRAARAVPPQKRPR